MANKSIVSFRDEVQKKIKNLILEFGQGKISNQQFDIIYERYYNQLIMAMQVIEGTAKQLHGNDISTIAIKDATAGKAMGMAVYHHNSGTILETMGNFDVSPNELAPVLNDFSDKLEQRLPVEPVTKKLLVGEWLVFMARKYTTVILVFRNEPAPIQLRQIENLLRDFEEANANLLAKMHVNAEKLAKPFIGFVQKKRV